MLSSFSSKTHFFFLKNTRTECTASGWWYLPSDLGFLNPPKYRPRNRAQHCYHHRSRKRVCLYSLETIFVTKQYLAKVQPLPGNIILLNRIPGREENQQCFELQLSWYFSLTSTDCDVQLERYSLFFLYLIAYSFLKMTALWEKRILWRNIFSLSQTESQWLSLTSINVGGRWVLFIQLLLNPGSFPRALYEMLRTASGDLWVSLLPCANPDSHDSLLLSPAQAMLPSVQQEKKNTGIN